MSMPTPIANPANSTFTREIGGTPHHAITAASTNATVVKAGPGTITQIACFSTGTAVGWLKLHDTAGAPVAGSTAIVQAYAVPAATLGNGFVLDAPIAFQHGIAYTFVLSSADADSDAGPAGVAINIIYR